MLQNIKRQIVVLTLTFIYSISPVYAKNHKPFRGKAHGCKLDVRKVDKTNTAKLICKDLEYERKQEFLDSKFLRWGTIKTESDTYITLFFSKGVHGERVVVFSKKKKKLVKDIPSSWPIEIEKIKDVMKLHYKKDSDKAGNFASFYYSLR